MRVVACRSAPTSLCVECQKLRGPLRRRWPFLPSAPRPPAFDLSLPALASAQASCFGRELRLGEGLVVQSPADLHLICPKPKPTEDDVLHLPQLPTCPPSLLLQGWRRSRGCGTDWQRRTLKVRGEGFHPVL